MIWAGIAFLLFAAWMAYMFWQVCRDLDGMPWASEVPLAIIVMAAAGGVILVYAGWCIPQPY